MQSEDDVNTAAAGKGQYSNAKNLERRLDHLHVELLYTFFGFLFIIANGEFYRNDINTEYMKASFTSSQLDYVKLERACRYMLLVNIPD